MDLVSGASRKLTKGNKTQFRQKATPRKVLSCWSQRVIYRICQDLGVSGLTFFGFYELKNRSRVTGEIKFPFPANVREGDRERWQVSAVPWELKYSWITALTMCFASSDRVHSLPAHNQGYGELVPSAFNQTRSWKWFSLAVCSLTKQKLLPFTQRTLETSSKFTRR